MNDEQFPPNRRTIPDGTRPVSRELPAKTEFAGASPSAVLHSMREDDEIEREIQAKGLTAPRVTPQRIEEVIVGEYYFTAADGVEGALDRDTPVNSIHYDSCLRLLTFCTLVLKNGFTVHGHSACASPENFNAELGRKIARQHAVQQIWQLEGYALRERLHEQALRNGATP